MTAAAAAERRGDIGCGGDGLGEGSSRLWSEGGGGGH